MRHHKQCRGCGAVLGDGDTNDGLCTLYFSVSAERCWAQFHQWAIASGRGTDGHEWSVAVDEWLEQRGTPPASSP